jgi:hypothetical protein
MKQLLELQLQYNSYGGMEKYTSEFEKYVQELEDIAPLSEMMKKTLFLEGIKDNDYNAKKDVCSLLTYEKCVQEMRNKAIELKKLSKPKPNRVTIHKMKAKRANKNQDEHSDDDSENEKGSYFPEEVWKQMSVENRKYIIKLKKEKEKNGKKVTFGSQYGKRGDNDEERSRNSNKVKAVSKSDEDDKTKEEMADDISKYQIWKPAINVRKQNLMKSFKDKKGKVEYWRDNYAEPLYRLFVLFM